MRESVKASLANRYSALIFQLNCRPVTPGRRSRDDFKELRAGIINSSDRRPNLVEPHRRA